MVYINAIIVINSGLNSSFFYWQIEGNDLLVLFETYKKMQKSCQSHKHAKQLARSTIKTDAA